MDADWAQQRIAWLEKEQVRLMGEVEALTEQLRSNGQEVEEPIPQDEIIARIETGWVPPRNGYESRTSVGQEYWYQEHALDIAPKIW